MRSPVFQLFLLFLLPFSCFSQSAEQPWKLYVSGAVNIPLIASPEAETTSASVSGGSGYTTLYYNPVIKENFSSYPGGKAGVELRRSLGSNFFAGMGMDLQLLRFRRTLEVESVPSLNDTLLTGSPYVYYYYGRDSILFTGIRVFPAAGVSNTTGKTATVFLDIPLYAGYTLPGSRLSVSLGFTAGVLAWSKQHKARTLRSGQLINQEYEDSSSDGLTNLRFTGNLDLKYALTKRLEVYGNYALPLTPIFDEDYRYAGKARCQGVEVGVRVGGW